MLLVTGCATGPDLKTAEAQPENCVREYRAGSNIPVQNCRATKTDAERQRMITDLENARGPAPARVTVPGG